MFYETLVRYYDDIFPPSPATLSFLHQQFQAISAGKILDLACGTGSYTMALAQMGYQAWGTDLEPEMIALAKTKAKETGSRASFTVGDMREPEKLNLTFDGLLCIGNSLAHLLDEKELGTALKSMASVLREDGVAVFQIVNYDRILARGDTQLPLIEREHLRFTRTYRPQSEELLIFDSLLEVKETEGQVIRLENSVSLHPIRRRKLERYLLTAGFSAVRTYGSFKGEEHQSQSQATIFVAKK